MPEFEEPMSRAEGYLQNALGAQNEMGEPQSRNEELLSELVTSIRAMDGKVPDPATADDGDVLGAVNGNLAYTKIRQLPAPTAADEGGFLTVVNGVPTYVHITDGNEVCY